MVNCGTTLTGAIRDAALPAHLDAVPHCDQMRAVKLLDYTSGWEAGEAEPPETTFPFTV